MSTHVNYLVAFVGKEFATEMAPEWFFIQMNISMFLHTVFPFESFRTGTADEMEVVRMENAMLLQLTLS